MNFLPLRPDNPAMLDQVPAEQRNRFGKESGEARASFSTFFKSAQDEQVAPDAGKESSGKVPRGEEKGEDPKVPSEKESLLRGETAENPSAKEPASEKEEPDPLKEDRVRPSEAKGGGASTADRTNDPLTDESGKGLPGMLAAQGVKESEGMGRARVSPSDRAEQESLGQLRKNGGRISPNERNPAETPRAVNLSSGQAPRESLNGESKSEGSPAGRGSGALVRETPGEVKNQKVIPEGSTRAQSIGKDGLLRSGESGKGLMRDLDPAATASQGGRNTRAGLQAYEQAGSSSEATRDRVAETDRPMRAVHAGSAHAEPQRAMANADGPGALARPGSEAQGRTAALSDSGFGGSFGKDGSEGREGRESRNSSGGAESFAADRGGATQAGGISGKPAGSTVQVGQTLQRVVESIEHLQQNAQQSRLSLSVDLKNGESLRISLRIIRDQVKVVFGNESEAMRIALRENWDQFQKQVLQRGLNADLPEFENEPGNQGEKSSGREAEERESAGFSKMVNRLGSADGSRSHDEETGVPEPVLESRGNDGSGIRRYA